MRVPGCVLAVVVLIVTPALAGAQGLGGAAAKERARRQKQAESGKPARTFSNDDLRTPAGREGAFNAAPGAPAAPASSGSSDAGRSDEGASSDSRLRLEETVTAAETRVRSLEEQQTKLEARLNPMSTTFVYGAAQQIDAIAEERRIREELRKTQADLAEARQQLATARQKLSDSGRNTPQASQY